MKRYVRSQDGYLDDFFVVYSGWPDKYTIASGGQRNLTKRLHDDVEEFQKGSYIKISEEA